MRTKTRLSNATLCLRGAVIAAAFLAALLARANSPFDIGFPIPELGGCTDKTLCKQFCDNSEHINACQAFAAKHGLGASRKEVDERFKQLEEDGGPGKCALNEDNPAVACKRYCDQQANIRECVSYAKTRGLMSGRELEDAERVVSALERGVKLPVQCKDAKSCKDTCEHPRDVLTARACFEFADAAGLLPPGVTRDQAEKLFTALAEGKTPFKSFEEMRQCENPETDAVLEKCINFGTEHGLISDADAVIVKKTGGRGPGGCRGREQCEIYCKEHREECFSFAEEHGLIKEEDRTRMKEGMEGLRKGLLGAPDEVRVCIKETVGAENLERILSGQRPPDPSIGMQIRECFQRAFQGGGGGGSGNEHFGPPMDFKGGGPSFPAGGGSPGEPQAQFNIPPAVQACLKEKFGDEFFARLREQGGPPSAELESKMKECFKSSFGEPQGSSGQDEVPSAPVPVGQGNFREGSFSGPGGCSTPQACIAYCSDAAHKAECRGFRGGSGMPLPGAIPEGYPRPPHPEGGKVYPPAGNFPPPPGGNYQVPPPTNFYREGVPPGGYTPESYPSTETTVPAGSVPTTQPTSYEGHSGFRSFFNEVSARLLGNIFSAFLRR